ncbi:hypothetical protein K402DRAFT_394332 [Aulographum hederae CBS 113979]|uniref:Secreted protein n=1 Tax=Aulographum hederae CBS 113979 TaxID=1176131 RepID=A0A6G1GXM8_9PEZI|nr:hypothetical protein K402DRAFT_394332 [Aulographum hederae CBS 113979]
MFVSRCLSSLSCLGLLGLLLLTRSGEQAGRPTWRAPPRPQALSSCCRWPDLYQKRSSCGRTRVVSIQVSLCPARARRCWQHDYCLHRRWGRRNCKRARNPSPESRTLVRSTGTLGARMFKGMALCKSTSFGDTERSSKPRGEDEFKVDAEPRRGDENHEIQLFPRGLSHTDSHRRNSMTKY